MSFRPFLRAFVLASIVSFHALRAAVPGDEHWDYRFGLPGVNIQVFSLLSTNGQLYAGGVDFFQGVTNTQVNIWNGSNWRALPNLFGGSAIVLDMAYFKNELYAAGSFISAAGLPTIALARWDGFGWRDVAGFRGAVSALLVDGNDLYVGGSFTNAGTVQALNIARWDGSAWHALGAGVGPFFDSGFVVEALVMRGNELFVGGSFSTAGGLPALNLARWNGSSWSSVGNVSGTVLTLTSSGTSLYVGGSFNAAGGASCANIAKWDDVNWSALGAGTGSSVYSIAVIGTNVFAGGLFTTAGGSTASRIAAWNGSAWSTLGTGCNDYVYKVLAIGSDLFVAGRFDSADGFITGHIAKWDGASWSGVTSPKGGNAIGVTPRAIAATSSNVYVGGIFTAAGRAKASRIAKWDGTSWSALGSGVLGTNSTTGTAVNAITVSGTNVFAGGVFTNAGGLAASNIARWNGTAWSPLGVGVGNSVLALTTLGNDLYVGGNFTSAGGVTRAGIARWDGTNWNSVGGPLTVAPGLNVSVSAFAVSGNDLYVGGQFHNAGGVNASNIAKWNGTTWSAVGNGVSSNVSSIAVIGSDVYVGGRFTSASGVAVSRIARWDGVNWSDVGGGVFITGNTPSVSTMAVIGTTLYVGGTFNTAGGTLSVNRLAKWEAGAWGSVGNGPTISSGNSGAVGAIAASGADLYVGGIFELAGDKFSANFGHWNTQKNFNPMQLQLSGIARQSSDRIQFNVNADYSDAFVIEASQDFTNWTPVFSGGASLPVTFVQSNASTAPRRFYRARQDY